MALDCLGWLEPSTLPSLAVELLMAGLDVPSLTLLAGEGVGADSRELRDQFHDALNELGLERPGRLEAAQAVKRKLAADVASRALSPRAGADAIVQLELHVQDLFPRGEYVGSGFGVAKLVGLYYSYDEVEHHLEPKQAALRAEIDAGIVAACERIAAGRDA